MLKVGLRFPLNSLHHELLKYLGLSVSQISLNAWRVFIAMEDLYGAMSNGAKLLTVQEFLHYYRPNEIDKSKGMYSFIPRKSVLKVIYETPNSNRDWKSRYFFLEGDGWMCHSGETDFMPVDKTWGILDPSGIYTHHIVYVDFFFISLNTLTVLTTPSPSYFLQYDDVPKLILSTTFLKKFSRSQN